ncbi:MAG: hypothetical protein K6E51_11800 [Treponema sp.]|nr:hypothetical protein [Treponema sp.]
METWIKYAPILLFDEKEPFAIKQVGCTLFHSVSSSPSFPGSPSRRRLIDPASKGAEFVVEYAYSYDYDIQHLYELEHVWIYVASDKTVCGCEASFHGKYLNQMIPAFPILPSGNMSDTHVRLYVQPGKHAFLPHPDLFALYPNADSCCFEEAGNAGLDTPEMFEKVVPVLSDTQQYMVKTYIKQKYAFKPSWHFREIPIPEELYTSWVAVEKEIPARIISELKKIGAF